MSKTQVKIKNRLRKQMMVLQAQLNEIESVERRKKWESLIGKCFIYDNGYSSDRRWPLYTRVIGINENDWLQVVRTQIDCDGKLEMEVATLTGEATLGKEISFSEFCKALNDARARYGEISSQALLYSDTPNTGTKGR